MAGRPTKFTDARQEAIIGLLKKGCTRRAAAASVGVGESTLSHWLADEEKEDFARAVLRAEGEAEIHFTKLLANAAVSVDPKYALEWLKRRRPDDWGDRIDVKQLPDDALVRFLNRAADQRGEAAEPADTAPAARNGSH